MKPFSARRTDTSVAPSATFGSVCPPRGRSLPRSPEELQTPTISVPQSAAVMRSARASEDLRVRSRHQSKRAAVQSADPRGELEVLVPPDGDRDGAVVERVVRFRDASKK
jgi:hypothetical protein